jgi:hypothetical protein
MREGGGAPGVTAVRTLRPPREKRGAVVVLVVASLAVGLGLVGALLNTEKHAFPEASGVPNHDAFNVTMWATLAVAVVFAGATIFVMLGPKRTIGAEAGLLLLSIVLGAVLSWLVLAVFLLAFFLPFVVGLGSREVGDIHAVWCFQFEEGCISAGEEFVRVFSEYMFLIAGVLSIPFGAVAGALGCMSRWRQTT